MNFKLCKYCKAQIPIKAKRCQWCKQTQDVDAGAIIGFGIAGAIVAFFAMLIIIGSVDDNSNNVSADNEKSTAATQFETQIATKEIETQYQTEVVTEKATTVDDLTEQQYKYMCRQIYYEDFKNKSVAEGEYVKLKIYTSGSYVKDPFQRLSSKFFMDNSLDGIYHSFCIQSKEFPTNYAPEGFIYFTSNYELDSSKYTQGKYFMVYGKIVKDDNYRLSVIPKYIESEEK